MDIFQNVQLSMGGGEYRIPRLNILTEVEKTKLIVHADTFNYKLSSYFNHYVHSLLTYSWIQNKL